MSTDLAKRRLAQSGTRKRHLTWGSNEKALKPRLFCLKNMLMSTYINIFLYSVVTSFSSATRLPHGQQMRMKSHTKLLVHCKRQGEKWGRECFPVFLKLINMCEMTAGLILLIGRGNFEGSPTPSYKTDSRLRLSETKAILRTVVNFPS